MKIFLERGFDAGHWLRNKDRGDAWNEETYGKCQNQHGHHWTVQVECSGNIDSETGMVVNFNEIKKVIDQFDHAVVNDFVKLPTAENIVAYILDKLIGMNRFKYIRVRIYETANAWAEDEWRSR